MVKIENKMSLSILLLGLISLSHIFQTESSKCPEFLPEIKSNMVLREDYKLKESDLIKLEDGTLIFVATTTLDGKYIQDGYATDTVAIAFNKRIEKCKTLNGEF